MQHNFTIGEFARLTTLEMTVVLIYKGILFDKYPEKENAVSVYRLFNFFVEVSRSEKSNTIVDITPFTQGFSFAAQKEMPQRADKRVFELMEAA